MTARTDNSKGNRQKPKAKSQKQKSQKQMQMQMQMQMQRLCGWSGSGIPTHRKERDGWGTRAVVGPFEDLRLVR
jgi:hypothetical protein